MSPSNNFTGISSSNASSQVTTSPIPSLASIELSNLTLSEYAAEVALNPNTNLLYVSDLFTNNITVVNVTTHAVVTRIELPGTPVSTIVVDPSRNTIYVSVYGCVNDPNVSNSCKSANFSTYQNEGIVRINASSNKIIDEIHVNVGDIGLDPNTNTLWGLCAESLCAINASSDSLIANISLHASSVGFALDPKVNRVYVAACTSMMLACGGAEILGFSENTYELVTNTSLPDFDAVNFGLTVDPASDKVYIVGLSSQNMTLVSIDGRTGEILYLSELGSSCSGAGGGTLVFDNVTNEIVVPFASQQYLLFINATDGQIADMVAAGLGVQYAYFNSNTQQIYLTENSSLLFLSTSFKQRYVDTSLLQSGICLP